MLKALRRDWVTPLTIGAFMLLAATGVLMFFHLDRGLNRFAHEWLSWVLIAAVLGHVLVNWQSFKQHMTRKKGLAFVGLFAVILLLSFFKPPGSDKQTPPSYAVPIQKMADAPLPLLAQLAGLSPDEVRSRLARAGVNLQGEQSLNEALAPADVWRQIRGLRAVMEPEAVPEGSLKRPPAAP